MQLSLSISSSSDRPANPSASPAAGSAWTMLAVTWPSSAFALLHECGPVGWFSRTCPASCQAMRDGILAPSSRSWGSAGMGSPTGFLTLDISEFHSGAVASSLSGILEIGGPLQRYFLSPKACAGILRRVEKRGKVLPTPLRLALAAVAECQGEIQTAISPT